MAPSLCACMSTCAKQNAAAMSTLAWHEAQHQEVLLQACSFATRQQWTLATLAALPACRLGNGARPGADKLR